MNPNDIPPFPTIPGASIEEVEHYMIIATMAKYEGRTAEVAKVLGISARKIQYRLAQYGATSRGIAKRARELALAATNDEAPRVDATPSEPCSPS